jgi:hypothetical protein
MAWWWPRFSLAERSGKRPGVLCVLSSFMIDHWRAEPLPTYMSLRPSSLSDCWTALVLAPLALGA